MILVAHRGWSTWFPENTLPAFAAAIGARADEIELDVWATCDRVPVVCHDPKTDRTCDLRGMIGEHTLADLRAAAVRMPDGSLLSGMGLPTLVEALDICVPRVAVNIHVKDPGPDAVILHELGRYFGSGRPACGSYIAGDRIVLSAAREIVPGVPRCSLEGQQDPVAMIDAALEFACERVQFTRGCYRPADIARAREHGLLTNLFWSDDPAEIPRLTAEGIQAILTNDIGPMRKALSAGA